uniref:Uncharacterized protein n=1 Tax=Panagrolaimus davidi TaxID=227884 RepID=A0A914Q3X4_9BILA
MFASTYYGNLDPTYRKALLKLEKDLSLISKDSEEQKASSYEIIHEFSLNYLTPNKFWDMLWELYEFTGRPNVRLNILPSIIYHFSYNDNIKFDMHYYKIPKRKLMHKESEVHAHFNKDVRIEDLCFPHNLLEYYLYLYETLYPNKHLPQKIIKCNYDMRKLYEKIKAVEENEEKWIKVMEEADDIETKKWNNFTTEVSEELLQTYSKYCRFFVDDISMKEEYEKAAKKYGKVTVPWKNAYDFEIFDESLLHVKYEHIPENENTVKKHTPLKTVFNNKIAVSQKFPFHATLIDYIIKNANAEFLQKLNFSCKYFYSKYHIPVCNYLFISSAGPAWAPYEIEEEALIFLSNTLTEVNFNNIYILSNFYYDHEIPLRNLIPKLYKCDAKYININSQKLTINELKFFIGHGNVVDLQFCRLKVIDGSGEHLFLEDILAFTPKNLINVTSFSAYEANCSPNTAQKLCELPFEKKFLKFSLLNGINVPLNPNAIGEFINKFATPDCQITINGVGNEFERTVETIIDRFWKTDQKPVFSPLGFP